MIKGAVYGRLYGWVKKYVTQMTVAFWKSWCLLQVSWQQ
jgi:hypothetical protein